MKLSTVTKVFVRTDIVVIGCNSENADVTNPRGEQVGYCAYLVAEAPDGSRWKHDEYYVARWESEVLEKIAYLEVAANEYLNEGGTLNSTHWTPIEPCYGSRAYEDSYTLFDGGSEWVNDEY